MKGYQDLYVWVNVYICCVVWCGVVCALKQAGKKLSYTQNKSNVRGTSSNYLIAEDFAKNTYTNNADAYFICIDKLKECSYSKQYTT